MEKRYVVEFDEPYRGLEIVGLFRSYKPKWVTVILAPTKDEAIERLHDLIIRLSRLYCKLTGKYLDEEANDD